MTLRRTSRRSFLKTKGAAAAGLAGLQIVRGSSWAAGGPNDRIGVGVIGVGGRGGYLTTCLMKLRREGLIDIHGVCDVYLPRVEYWSKRAGCRPYDDWRKLLENKRIDGVVIATPDHWHAPMTIAACQAGKDVYCEKPMTYWKSIEEPKAVVRAVAEHKRVMQVGTNGMSDTIWRQARARIRTGRLGRVMQAQASDMRNGPISVYSPKTNDGKAKPGENLNWDMWLGSAPKRPFEPGRFFAFRSFWDYSGGTCTDFLPHLLTPILYILDLGFPRRVVSSGGLYFWKDGREVPDIFTLLIEYPEGPQVYLPSGLASDVNIPKRIRGQSATMTFTGPGAVIEPQRHGVRKTKYEEIRRQRGESTVEHLRDWLTCMRTRKKPISNEIIGYKVMVALQMGVHSYLENKAMLFDPEKEEYRPG